MTDTPNRLLADNVSFQSGRSADPFGSFPSSGTTSDSQKATPQTEFDPFSAVAKSTTAPSQGAAAAFGAPGQAQGTAEAFKPQPAEASQPGPGGNGFAPLGGTTREPESDTASLPQTPDVEKPAPQGFSSLPQTTGLPPVQEFGAAPEQSAEPMEWVPVPDRGSVTLPSGRELSGVGAPMYDMPEPIRSFETKRDRLGRYILPDPRTSGEQSFTRATTYAKALSDNTGGRRALDNYSDRMLLKGLVKNPELLEGFDASLLDTAREKDLNSSFESVASTARSVGGGSDKADFGTAVHAWTESLDHGQISFDQVPEMFRPYVATYRVALQENNVEIIPEYIERIVMCPDTETAGTADRIFRINGEMVIGDIKTSSNIDYSWVSIACQLAQYADASHMLSEDGTRMEPMPQVNKQYGVIAEIPALPKGRGIYCDLHVIDLSVGREANQLAAQVRDFNRSAKSRVPLQRMEFAHTAGEAEQMVRQEAALSPAASPDTAETLPDPAAGVSNSTVDPGELTAEDVSAALSKISTATTVAELDALFEPRWQSEQGRPLMEAATQRARAIENNSALRA